MRTQVDFKINKNLEFYNPLNEAMTAFIYRMIAIGNKEYAKQLHDGYSDLGYKTFVHHSYSFSQNKKTVQFELKKGKATLIFSSVLEDTIINFTKGLMKTGQVQLFGYSFDVEEITFIKEPKLGVSNVFRILSPVNCAGSGYKWLNIKEVEEKAITLLIEKYYALHGRLPKNADARVKFLSNKAEYIKYKGVTFRAYNGTVVIEGDKDIVKLAHQGGLGCKCGIGMGLLEKI